MINLIFWLAVIFVSCSVSGVAIGFWKTFEFLPLWVWCIGLTIYVGVIFALGIAIYRTYRLILEHFKTEFERIKDWLKSLTPMEILKIILGIIKK